MIQSKHVGLTASNSPRKRGTEGAGGGVMRRDGDRAKGIDVRGMGLPKQNVVSVFTLSFH